MLLLSFEEREKGTESTRDISGLHVQLTTSGSDRLLLDARSGAIVLLNDANTTANALDWSRALFASTGVHTTVIAHAESYSALQAPFGDCTNEKDYTVHVSAYPTVSFHDFLLRIAFIIAPIALSTSAVVVCTQWSTHTRISTLRQKQKRVTETMILFV